MIRQGQRLFSDEHREVYPNEMNFAYLAVRNDLPTLCAEDVAFICNVVERISRNEAL